MKFLKSVLDFYLTSSFHVAFSAMAFVKMTQFMFKIQNDNAVVYFVFFGTIAGYNFVKYDALARVQKIEMSQQLKVITVLSFLSFLLSAYCFFQLLLITQILGIVFFLITLFYTLPFFPNKKNARNWAGIKIYIVALCWVGITVFLPIINSQTTITLDFYIKSIQRFILVFVLILIFEIIDLKKDDPHLKTVPQQIGVRRTKILGYVLLTVFSLLEILIDNINSNFNFRILNYLLIFIIAIIIAIFLYFSNENKSKYYSSFWVESVPIFWWILLVVFG